MTAPKSHLSRARVIEIAVATLLTLAVAISAPLHLYVSIIRSAFAGLSALIPLRRVDPETTATALIALLRAVLIVAPVIYAFARAKPARWIWAPLTIIPLILALSLAPHGLVETFRLALLAALSLASLAAQHTRLLRFTAAIPALLAFHPTVTTHQKWTLVLPGARTRLTARCNENPGERPVGTDSNRFTPSYYAVTPLNETRLLLTGEVRSYWLTREPNGSLRVAENSQLSGNYWRGTLGQGSLWLAHRDAVHSAQWNDGHEVVQTFSLLGVRESWEIDALDAVFDRATESVFVGEFASGSLLQVPIDGRPARLHPLDLIYLQLAPTRSGTIVGVSTHELVVIDTATASIRQRIPAALYAGGLASCSHDSAVAVTDILGRVRLFELNRDGQYSFVRGVAARSPRRVAFSADCNALAVTSSDDEMVVVLSRGDLSVLKSYRLGPGLRDLQWMANGDLLVVDACTVTRLRPLGG